MTLKTADGKSGPVRFKNEHRGGPCTENEASPWRRRGFFALGLLLLFVAAAAATRAAARDVDALAQIVAPAYTAMNFAMVCREDDPWFLWDTRGPRGTALHYAEHVKDEVIASLGYDEAVAVLSRAADTARATAREALRKASPDYPNRQPGEIIGWCRGAASTFIQAFMERHDDIHEALLQEIERAKQ